MVKRICNKKIKINILITGESYSFGYSKVNRGKGVEF